MFQDLFKEAIKVEGRGEEAYSHFLFWIGRLQHESGNGDEGKLWGAAYIRILAMNHCIAWLLPPCRSLDEIVSSCLAKAA